MSRVEMHQPHYLPPSDRCSGDALIEMADIVKVFRSPAGEFTALKGVTACFYPGEYVSVVGKSGSGKSTLVNMITGIDHPTSGSVRIGNTFVHALNENDMSLWRGKNLGIVFQFFQLLPTLTLQENVMLPMYLAGMFTPIQREQRALDLLNRVGLSGMEDKLPAAVSGGQQQSVAIARALATDPPILIADEPTGNLDSLTADEVFNLFSGFIHQGKTILMVTHDISLAKRTTRTLLIVDGELINPWIASALHSLEHADLLWLSHHMNIHASAPGKEVEDVYKKAESATPRLLIITAGMLEIIDDANAVQRIIGPGDFYFSPGWQTRDPAADFKHYRFNPYRDSSVEYLLVDGLEFQYWLTDHKTVQQHLLQSELNRTPRGNETQ